MKNQLLKPFLAVLLMILFTGNLYAVTTWNWQGGTIGALTDWATGTNWTHTGTIPTDSYPGQTVSSQNDVVQIGVTNVIPFGNNPVLSSSTPAVKIATLNFGTNGASAILEGFLTLTVNGTLNVTGIITQIHATVGIAGSGGSCDPLNPGVAREAVQTILAGTGTLNCAFFTIGDTSVPTLNLVLNYTLFKLASLGTTVTTLAVNVTNAFTIQSATKLTGTTITSNNNAVFSFSAGTLNVGGTLSFNNFGMTTAATDNCDEYSPFAQMSMDLNATGLTPADNPVLNLSGIPTAISMGNAAIVAKGFTNNFIDFYNPVGGTGTTTVNYKGPGAQEVFTSGTSRVDVDPSAIYDNLGFGGSGTKTPDGGNLAVAGNFTLAAGTETVNLATNNPTTTVSGNYFTATGTSLTSGTGTVTISGTSYSNSGTSTFGAGLVTFNSATTAAFTGTGSSDFTNVAFSGGNTNNMTAGTYNVVSTGVLTMSNNTALAAGGFLTLKSAATSSASIAAIPAGCGITGNVNVQRYVTGGAGNRGYRIISSPVNTGTTDGSGNTLININYLKNSIYLTGTTAAGIGGFDNTVAANPTLYLFRENLAPLFTTFLNSNFRGINNIATAPIYGMDDSTYPTANIPVGTGYLCFFRGDRSTSFANKTTQPFPVPENTTLTATGLLNQGTIKAVDWYTPGSPNLGWTATAGNGAVQGFNLVGNPYASSIDWDKLGTAIDTTALAPFVYVLNLTGQTGSGAYGVYQAGTGGAGTNNATNIIASGVGFFVIAKNATAKITFTEAAKTNTQPVSGSLFMAKIPVAAAAPRYLRLQMEMDSINTVDILVRFNDQAKTAFDFREDAPYRAGTTGKVNLSSLSSDDIPLAINQLPLPARGQTIPLAVNAIANGTYALNLKQVNGVPQLYDIWLKDAYTKDSVNMRKTPAYSFNIALSDTNSFGSKRFSLVLSQDTAFSYKLLSFDASKVDKKRQVEVIWKTANEQNYTHFTVQRSTDNGKNFDVIGSVASDGQGTYSLIDKDPAKGENLYRLKQEDYNSITFSNVVDVKLSDNGNDNNVRLHVYPNPAVNNITLDIDPTSQHVATYKIRISNSFGTVVKQVVTTQTNWQDNVSQLFTGTYLIQVVNDKDNTLVGQTKFVKL